MKHSSDRILTTHVGSLPRPENLLAVLEQAEAGDLPDVQRLHLDTAQAVRDIARTQIQHGMDVIGDGEMSKISYTFYVRHRLAGVTVDSVPAADIPQSASHQDLVDHPEYAARMRQRQGATTWMRREVLPVCTGPVEYAYHAPLERDVSNLEAAVREFGPTEAFINAASPGVLTKFVPDVYYRDEDAYVEALANAMQVEYEGIHAAGFVLQIDAPDLGSARHNQYSHLCEGEFIRIAERNIDALNHATRNIPPDAMRLHICWGNYEGPHTRDIPLQKMLPTCMRARPDGFLFEGANPRHAHEWQDIRDAHIPDSKVLFPGVIDSTTNFVEHPRLVAERIVRYARIVGRERVIASTDCGFATFAGPNNAVVPSARASSFAHTTEGARLANDALWP